LCDRWINAVVLFACQGWSEDLKPSDQSQSFEGRVAMVSKAVFIVLVLLVWRLIERNTPVGSLEKAVGVGA
jgi:hypothetical protein